MQSVLLSTPSGISARLGWDPKLDDEARIRALARELVAAHAQADESLVRIAYEAPAHFGHRVQLEATLDHEPYPLVIKAASFRAASVVGISEPEVPIGIDIRDLLPDEAAVKTMRRHSHLPLDTSDVKLLAHWTRVQAVLEADGRGLRVHPEHVRLDAPLDKGWVPDRPTFYRLTDISRDGFVITLAHALPHR